MSWSDCKIPHSTANPGQPSWDSHNKFALRLAPKHLSVLLMLFFCCLFFSPQWDCCWCLLLVGIFLLGLCFFLSSTVCSLSWVSVSVCSSFRLVFSLFFLLKRRENLLCLSFSETDLISIFPSLSLSPATYVSLWACLFCASSLFSQIRHSLRCRRRRCSQRISTG